MTQGSQTRPGLSYERCSAAPLMIGSSATHGLTQSKRLVGRDSRGNSIGSGPRSVVPRTSGIARSVDTRYGGLFICAGADKTAGWAFVKFATKLFGERAGHASSRVRKQRIDGNDAPVVQAEPRESGWISEHVNYRFGFDRNSAHAEIVQLLRA